MICFLFYSSFVCTSACANIYFKTTFMCPRSMAGVPFDSVRRFRATLYCTPLVCVSDVIESLAVWQHNKPKTNKQKSQAAGKMKNFEFSEIGTTNAGTSVPSYSLVGPYNWSHNHVQWRQILHGAEEEHGKECSWQLGAVSESAEQDEGWFIQSLSPLRYLSCCCGVLQYVVQ